MLTSVQPLSTNRFMINFGIGQKILHWHEFWWRTVI